MSGTSVPPITTQVPPPPCTKPCGCSGANGSGGPQPAMMSTGPVRYLNGDIAMAVDDLSSQGFGSPWGHRRSYSNQIPYNYDFGNGYNWLVENWPYLVQKDANTIAVIYQSQKAFWFTWDGSTYVAQHGAQQTLVHDQANNVFIMTDPDGQVWQFQDFDQYQYPEGLFKQATSPGGIVTAVTQYSGVQIGEVQRSYQENGHTLVESYLYTYIANGENIDRLESVTLRRKTDDGPWDDLRRVRYTYYASNQPFGSPGDLETAVRQVLVGTTWVDADTSYYRYYQAGDANGFEHGLKFILEPDAFAELAADPDVADPLAASDAKLAQYASYYYEYDASRRVVAESVAGGSREFTYAYTSGPSSSDYNQWATKTVESRPDGSQKIVYTNFIGSVILQELNSGTDQWVQYYQYDSEGRLIQSGSPRPSRIIPITATAA